MDFSSASTMNPGAPEGPVYGTPQTAAPERLLGETATSATDVYSAGVLLFRLVTGRFPVEGRSYEELLEKHARGDHTPVRELRPSIPIWFASIVDRAVAPAASARFASVVRMERALVDGLRKHTPPPSPVPVRFVIYAVAMVLVLAAFDTPPRLSPGTEKGALHRIRELVIEASLMADRTGAVVPLTSGERIRPGDGVFLEIRSEEPVWAYVINRDRAGTICVLHPLPGFNQPNPLSPGAHRLPGQHEGETAISG